MSDAYKPPKWIRLKSWSGVVGISEEAFRAKVNQGELIEQEHFLKAPDGKYMVNWEKMDEWAESGARH